MSKVPLIYYPTTLYWIDDDELFLESVTHIFKNEYKIKKSSSPRKSLEFFLDYRPYLQKRGLIKARVQDEDYELPNHLPMDIDLNEIRCLLNEEKKFEDIGVLIVDYHMPELTGIELFQKIAHLPIKKILLTGDSDLHKAIDAFNQGIINSYLRKDDPQLDISLLKTIHALSLQYFIDQTSSLLNHIQSDSPLPQSDEIFKALFYDLCQEKSIEEYYLIDKFGSVLLIDRFKKKYYLIIHTDKTLNSFIELYSNVSNEFELFIRGVKNRIKIPFFGLDRNPWDLDLKEWANCFYTPQVLKGLETYYYCLVDA